MKNNIFKNKIKKSSNKTKKLTKKELLAKKQRERQIANEKIGREKKKKLNPMVGALLNAQYQKYPNNDFLKNSLDVVSNHPYRLTEKWINSLNKWAKELMEKLALDEPDIPLGEKIEVTIKIEKRKESDWGGWRYTGIDKSGWRFNFGSGKTYEIDSFYIVKGTVKKHYEGMTILSRTRCIKTAPIFFNEIIIWIFLILSI